MDEKPAPPEFVISDEEDARIAQAVAEDPDTFLPDADWLAKARVVVPDIC